MFPQAHGLIIGISDYKYIRTLSSAPIHDAQDLRNLLVAPDSAGYPVSQVNVLLNSAATKQGILAALESLALNCDADSTVWISFAGHGGRLLGEKHRGEYLLPVETHYDSEAALAQSAISTAELSSHLTRIPARKLVLVLDCCHAGGIGQLRSANAVSAVEFQAGLSRSAQADLATGRGRALLLASRDSEPANELAGDRNGLFTKHLLAGLRGGAQRTGGLVRICDLFEYAQRGVKNEAPDQHPVFKAELEENFPIARCSVTVAEAPASSLDGYKQDVFVHALEAGPDREWLRKVLRPALLKRNLRVWDADQFLLGMPRIRAIESAVESSRYTVAVLSPAYLENGFSELGDLIAQHLGTEQRSYRLLGVIRQNCTPRLGMRLAPLLDLTPAEDFEAQVDRLAYSIRQPLPRPK